MQLLPRSYADFVTLCKTLDTDPKVAYFPHEPGKSYFLYGYLPSRALIVQYQEGGIEPENFPAFTTDFPDALLMHSTIGIVGDRLLQFNNLADYQTFMTVMPAPLVKIVFGMDGEELESYATVGANLVVELEGNITSEAFLADFPLATQLQSQVECSAEFG
jgi:hypothetical protein